MGGGGVRVAESLEFSPGDEQQETTHLHFQRPALSTSPPPGRPGSKALPSSTIAAGGGEGGDPEGEDPIGFPRPQPPPLQNTPPTHGELGLEAGPLASK